MTKIDDPSRFKVKTNRPALEVLSAITFGLLMTIIMVVTMERAGVLRKLFDLWNYD